MDALGYYPSSWDRIPLALSGLVAILLALVSLALIALRRDTLVARPQALAGGLCMALVWALACGNAFLYAQSLTGGPSFFLAPIDIRAGLFSGIGLGALAVLAIGAFVMFRSMATAGMMLGAAIGLVIFRLVFGPTAGFGGEVGFGVGQEVGVMCGAAGGLLGGILGSILGGFFSGERAASSREDAQQPMTSRDGSRLVVALAGLVGGGAVGGVVAETGANIGLFQFLIPYNAQVPDVAPDTSPTGLLHDFQFGLGLFIVGGALIGCFLALQWMSSDKTGARRHGVWLGVGLVVALISGLTFGLDHRFVGGPLLSGHPQIALDPVATVRGLLIGLGVGMAFGALLLVFIRITRTRGRLQAALRTTLTLIIGILLVSLPYWYTPIFAISIM